MGKSPVFSLIMATYGRTEEVANFLSSINRQTCRDFELIIVDQNDDDRLCRIIEPYEEIASILHIRSSIKGLSHARNIGIAKASGDFVLFPDDDYEYPEDLLESIKQLFDHGGWGLISGRVFDKHTNKLTLIKCPPKRVKVTVNNMWFTVTSGNFAIRRNIIEKAAIRFDERFGLGSKYGSAEELDFAVKVMKSGCNTLYIPEIVFYHPEKEFVMSDNTIARAGAYAYGMGAVCCKILIGEHVLSVLPFFLGRVMRPLVMWLVYFFLSRNKAMFYRACLIGRLRGFVDFFKEYKNIKKGVISCA